MLFPPAIYPDLRFQLLTVCALLTCTYTISQTCAFNCWLSVLHLLAHNYTISKTCAFNCWLSVLHLLAHIPSPRLALSTADCLCSTYLHIYHLPDLRFQLLIVCAPLTCTYTISQTWAFNCWLSVLHLLAHIPSRGTGDTQGETRTEVGKECRGMGQWVLGEWPIWCVWLVVCGLLITWLVSRDTQKCFLYNNEVLQLLYLYTKLSLCLPVPGWRRWLLVVFSKWSGRRV